MLHIFEWLPCLTMLPSSMGLFWEKRSVEALEGSNPWDYAVCLLEKVNVTKTILGLHTSNLLIWSVPSFSQLTTVTMQVEWGVLPVSCSNVIMIWKTLLQTEMVTIYLLAYLLKKWSFTAEVEGWRMNSQSVRANLLQDIEKVLRRMVTWNTSKAWKLN